MAEPIQPHVFNTDLLDHPEDRAQAKFAYPGIFHVLDDEEFRRVFHEFDNPANAAKKRSRRAGLLAVMLAVFALGGTSAQPLYGHSMWAIIFGLMGLLSILVGLGGVLISGAKRRWLYQRMVGERLRQFHFQMLVCRIGEIEASTRGEAERQRFLDERARWLAQFVLRFRSQMEAEFNAILQNENAPLWLHPAPQVTSAALHSLPPQLAEELFAAYRDLRIRHQLQYADYQLGHGQGLLAKFSLRRQDAIFANTTLIATLLLFLIEFLIIIPPSYEALAKFLLQWVSSLPPRLPAWFTPTPEYLAHWAAICCAIVALGVRTLAEGLHPRREIERYSRYRIEVQDILERFETARSFPEKLAIMIDLERLSVEEMRDFLRSAYEARFVM